jgi:crystallin alpha B
MLEDELFPPTPFRGWYLRPRRRDMEEAPQRETGMSEVTNTDKDFKINLDVSHFKPEELNVKTIENKLVIHAKHEERPDEHGFIQREFKRMYILPKEVDPEIVKSSLSADGILTITAPKLAIEGKKERSIPIEQVPAVQQ